MRGFWLYAFLLGAVVLGVHLQGDGGYVLIRIGGWYAETTVWFFLLLLFFLGLVVSGAARITHFMQSIPHRIHKGYQRYLQRKARHNTRQGLIEFSEGYWHKASRHLIAAIPHASTPLINYLTAARAEQELGNARQRDNYLRQAQQNIPEASIAIELTQAQLQIANNQNEQALATLNHLRNLAPHHPYVVKLLAEVYEKIKDWEQVLSILPLLENYRILSKADAERKHQEICLLQLKTLIRQGQEDKVQQFVELLPKKMRSLPEVIESYTEFLLRKGDVDAADKALKQAFKYAYSENMVHLLGKLPSTSEQVHFAEQLLRKNSHSPALLSMLGRLCLEEKLYGKAKTYLEEAILLEPHSESYRLLGELHEQCNEPTLAFEAYKQAALCKSV